MPVTYLAPPTEKETAAIQYIIANVKGKLREDDTYFFIDEMLALRFLRQKDGKQEKALALLEDCIKWRNEYAPHRVTLEEVSEWASVGMSLICGLTKNGAPILHVRPVPGLKVDVEMRTRYLIWMFEELMRRGYWECVTVLDFSSITSSPPKEETQARERMDHIRSHYYPLFEAKIFCVSMPLIIRAVFAIVVSFMSDAQKATMETGLKPKHLLEWIAPEELLERLGGGKKLAIEGETLFVKAMMPRSLVTGA
jgi:hypothetical protein